MYKKNPRITSMIDTDILSTLLKVYITYKYINYQLLLNFIFFFYEKKSKNFKLTFKCTYVVQLVKYLLSP